MTVHGPGTPLYWSEIQGEFGGGNPVWMSNYYAGGPNVPAGTVGAYGAVPAGGEVWMSQYYGTSKWADRQYLYAEYWSATNNTLTGYNPNTSIGSISDGSLNMYGGGAHIWSFVYMTQRLGSPLMYFSIDGQYPNSGWSSMVVDTPGLGVFTYYPNDVNTRYYTSNIDNTTSWEFWYGPNPFTPGVTSTITFWP